MNRLRVGILLLFICAGSSAQTLQGVNLIGSDSSNHVITTAVPFLSITPDSRAAGMGDVGAATSADANSAYWNAGKMAFIDKDYGVSGSYTPWLGKIINDMSIFYLAGFYKLNHTQTLAASMKYFDLGEIQFNNGPDPIANNLGRFNPREFAFDVTYSQLLTENLGIGGSLRYINSNLTGALSTGANDARPGKSVAVDIGLFYSKPLVSKNSNISFAGSITNIGSKITYSDANNKDFIPTNLRLGGAFKTDINPYNSLTFGLDFNKLLVPSPGPGSKGKQLLSGMFGSFTDAAGGFSEEIREITTALGLEYWYNNGTGGSFAGRAGYFFEAWDKGNRKYLTMGVGGRLNQFGLDVAYLVPTNKRESALAETIRFTFSVMVEKKTIQETAPVD